MLSNPNTIARKTGRSRVVHVSMIETLRHGTDRLPLNIGAAGLHSGRMAPTEAHPSSPHDAESEYELPPVHIQPLTDGEQLARNIVESARKNGEPLPPIGGGYNAARMGRR